MGVSSLPIISLLLLSITHDVTSDSPAPQPGDVRACLGAPGIQRFEVLPGSGWDNLRNTEAGTVVALNYSLCRSTDDGRYVIPDIINVYPVKTSRVDSFAEVMSSGTDYVSATSRDINAEAGLDGLFSISGSFSDDYTRVKTSLIEDDTFTTRVQARYVRYRAVLQPDMPLDPGFKYRLMTIAGSLELGDHRQARFDAQQLVREFGTHVSIGVEAGAALMEENQISNDIKNRTGYSDKAVKIAAGVSFTSKIGKLFAGVSDKTSTTKDFLQVYTDNTTDSLVTAIGGPITNKTNTTIEDWVSQMSNDLVAIGRSGEPIHSFINAQTIPELPGSTLMQLVAKVKEAVAAYYKVNTHPGCTDRTAANFSPRANVQDGSCRPPAHNTSLGGVFQTCNHSQVEAGDLCADVTQTNPATGDYTCPTGYEAVPLYSGNMTHQAVDHVCGSCWLVFGHCCHDNVRVSQAQYSTFWCAPTGQGEAVSGYLFGGVYTTHLVNHLTGSMSCPHGFVGLRLGEHARVCVSDMFDEAEERAVPFAGFFSCSAGNPLALTAVSSGLFAHVYSQGPAQWPRECPLGYSRYVTDFMPGDGCEVNHCAQTSALSHIHLPALRRPPFNPAPTTTPSTQNVFIFDQGQNLWVKNQAALTLNKTHHDQTSLWSRMVPASMTKEEIMLVIPQSNQNHKKETLVMGDQMAWVSAGVLGLLILAVTLNLVLLTVVLRRRFRERGNSGHGGHGGHDNHVALASVGVGEKRRV